jgi:hypothetical protein
MPVNGRPAEQHQIDLVFVGDDRLDRPADSSSASPVVTRQFRDAGT